ncbi:MAG: acetyl-CoA hydrolase/transferase C-terminal domain-containing protein [Burkholderiaceae bacterium]
MSAEPVALLQSLAKAALPHALQLMLGVPFSLAAAELPAHCEITTYGGMGSASQLALRRVLHLSPLHYGRSAKVYEQGLWPCDVALVSLARASDGSLHLGASHGPLLAAARRARHVIAEINAQAPCIPGAPWPTDLSIAAVIETDHALAPLREPAPTAAEQDIARQVAALVPNGACLQVGIGALPSAALAALGHHRHLGVHSGSLTDSLQALVDTGAVDHSRKTIDAGVAVVGSVLGTHALYSAAHQNPALCLREPGYTHDAAVIAAIDDFFSLNSAIEVDLLGNVNAECVAASDGRWRHVGGVGGLPEFVRAARLSRNGQAVIALPARTARDKPRIVARLNGPCTIAATDADCVVTEFGVARLRDASYGQRVRQMLDIAHPDDRDALIASARTIGLL